MANPSQFPNTPEQDLILQAWKTTKQSLMIQALAGTGKTSTLVLLSSVMQPRPTLAVVFNKKNQEEMKAKFPAFFDTKTLNGLGYSALQRYLSKRLQLADNKTGDILKAELKTRGIQKLPDGVWEAVVAMVTHTKVAGIVTPTYSSSLKALIPWDQSYWEDWCLENFIDFSPELLDLVEDVCDIGIAQAKSSSLVDFNDMIYLSALGWGSYERYPTVLVDEAQDLSPLNHLQIRKSVEFNGRLVVVGDPHQAIYAFRGADHTSMASMRELRKEEDWEDLKLSVTFRCPQAVVDRQHDHVPDYQAHSTNPEGEVIQLLGKEWSLSDIPSIRPLAILCRNTAPLLSCAFRLIRGGYGVTMLGRDIGKSLVKLVDKICGKENKPLSAVLSDVKEWEARELSKAEELGKESLMAVIQDRAGCLLSVAEADGVKDLESLKAALISLFENQAGQIILGTAHRAKGLEWPTVIHLDPWRIPSRQSLKAEKNGDPNPLIQEKNLRYVLETRSKQTLILANLEDFTP